MTKNLIEIARKEAIVEYLEFCKNNSGDYVGMGGKLTYSNEHSDVWKK